MKKDSWDSEFRKKRFYENQRRKALNEKLEDISSINSILKSRKKTSIPRSIAIMLDLEKTCDKITDKEAEIFMKQVDTLRKQFGNESAYICISTHSSTSTHIKMVFDILNKYRNENIGFGTSFIYGGKYSYSFDSVTPMGFLYNSDKIQTFTDHYLHSLNVGWIALIDDSLNENVYKSFQHSMPMVGLKPSGKKEDIYNNFMYRATDTDNFSGVIELMDKYIKDIRGMTLDDIAEEQKKMTRHLSSWELHQLLINYQFEKVIKYLNSGMADADDFKNTYKTIMEYPKNILGEYRSDIIELLVIIERSKVFSEPVKDIVKLIFS